MLCGMTTEHIILPSGVEVLFKNAPIHGFAVGMKLSIGHKDGLSTRPGLAHFVEHLLALGESAKFSSLQMQDYYKITYDVSPNASTDPSNTLLLRGNLPYGMYGFDESQLEQGVMDALAHFTSLTLSDADIERERERIRKEILERLSDPIIASREKLQRFFAQAFPDSIMSIPRYHLGGPETAIATTRAELLGFYTEHHLNPSHWQLQILGPYRPDSLLAKVDTLFSQFPATPIDLTQPAIMNPAAHYCDPPPSADSNSLNIILGLEQAGLPSQQARAPIVALCSILGDYLTSDAISGASGYGMGVSIGYGPDNPNLSLKINYESRDEALGQLQKFFDRLHELANTADTKGLERAKRRLQRSQMFDVTDAYGELMRASNDIESFGKILGLDAFYSAIGKVTADDVVQAAQHALSTNVGVLNEAPTDQRIGYDEVIGIVKGHSRMPITARPMRPTIDTMPHKPATRGDDIPEGAT